MEKTDAIAIECYSRENGQRATYYYPYTWLTVDKLEFEEPWGIMAMYNPAYNQANMLLGIHL